MLIKPSKTALEKVGVVAVAFAVLAIWMNGVWAWLVVMGILPDISAAKPVVMSTGFAISLIFSDVWAPVWEEFIFRDSVIKLGRSIGPKAVWPLIFISSAYFGWGHGKGPYSILLQGVMGLVCSFVYIKNGYSYWSAVAVHMLWNLSVEFGLW